MSHFPRWLTIAAFALIATSARAEFHTFQIEQMYSNADGSLQFVVLHESQGMNGENFLQGQVLTSTHLGVTKTYIFPTNLPGGSMYCDGYYGCYNNPSPTANSRVLIATQGFAALNLVSPDYTIPNGFLPVGGGTLNYATVDQLTFASLPTDGVSALSRSGAIIPNVATNFVGYSASVVAAAGVNYQGLWFNPPEAGWARCHRGGRRCPVDLRVPRRRDPQHPRLPGPVHTACPRDHAGDELSLHPSHPGRLERRDRLCGRAVHEGSDLQLSFGPEAGAGQRA